MIKVLGIKRIMILLILIGVNAAVGSATFLYLVPEKAVQDRNLRSQQSKVSAKDGDIKQLTVEVQLLKEQQDDFKIIVDRGFFNNQSRSDARSLLERVRSQSGVITANVDGGELTNEASEGAEKAGYVLLSSTVNVKIGALQDRDVYRYINLLKSSLPGHLSIEKISIDRKLEISGEVLRLISSNQKPKLVVAEISLLWRTMIPAEEYARIEDARR